MTIDRSLILDVDTDYSTIELRAIAVLLDEEMVASQGGIAYIGDRMLDLLDEIMGGFRRSTRFQFVDIRPERRYGPPRVSDWSQRAYRRPRNRKHRR